MTNFYDWKAEHTGPFITITSVSIGFAIYWFLSTSEKIKQVFFNKFSSDQAWVTYVFFQKMMGVLFMGLLPGIVVLFTTDYSISDLGINLGGFNESLIYVGIIGAIILVANYFASRNTFNLSMYPQMRIKEWDVKTITINTVSWIAYLFAYEFMYRGMLLIVCYHSFGFWPAVAINLSFYSATHIAKGLVETVGTFPYGLVLCFVTISTGSILVAFLTHLILALSNDYFSIYHNPETNFK